LTNAGPVFDKSEQLAMVQPYVLSTERLFAVYDCKGAGTGFVGITNKRLIFYDKQFMSRKKAMVSVPFSRITSVGAVDEGGILTKTSELVVKAGSETYEFEFRGGGKAVEAYKFIMSELLQPEMA
jgi:hypothetical protein